MSGFSILPRAAPQRVSVVDLWRRIAALILIVLLVCVAVWQAHGLALSRALHRGQERAETTLRLTEQALAGYLGRYQAVPLLLADLDAVRDLASYPDDPARREAINSLLAHRNRLLGSSEIYVMRTDGTTIAASNHDDAKSFVGQVFNYRPYFMQAMDGEAGRFYGIGTTSGLRGYFFSAPVRNRDEQIAGVVAVKIGLDDIEASWRGTNERIFVSDPDGILFMASEPSWKYRVIIPSATSWQTRQDPTQRYDGVAIRPLLERKHQINGLAVSTITENGRERDYLTVSQPMVQAGWTVNVMLNIAEWRTQARTVAALFLAVACFLIAIGLIVMQRRTRDADRLAMQIHATQELERRVAERTVDLAQTNRRLHEEIVERQNTETELRAVQDSLVQVGKLAALGQMSAALSHEINQPLAAARNYADSAAILIGRGDHDRARGNILQIMTLLDRISAIGKHLRNAARKPGDRLVPVHLNALLRETEMIMAVRLAAAKATLVVDVPPDLPPLLAGPTRLQQVLVNLVTNAADAVEDMPDRRIILTARDDSEEVVISVRDFGPGVAPALADRIFDPFFTTKGSGAGLGLGLSISANIMRDFGGRIACHDAGPGALFRLSLRIARSDRIAA